MHIIYIFNEYFCLPYFLLCSELVNVGENCVSGKDGVKREVDVIIFATGFDVLAGLGDLKLSGTEGTVFTNL